MQPTEDDVNDEDATRLVPLKKCYDHNVNNNYLLYAVVGVLKKKTHLNSFHCFSRSNPPVVATNYFSLFWVWLAFTRSAIVCCVVYIHVVIPQLIRN